MKKDVRRDNIDSSLLFYENVRKKESKYIESF